MYAASRASNIELLLLILDFMVNSMLKNTLNVECMKCLNKDAKKKKGQIRYTGKGVESD